VLLRSAEAVFINTQRTAMLSAQVADLHRSSQEWPTSQCRLANFPAVSRARGCCHCQRRPDFTTHYLRTTDPFLTCQLCPRSYSVSQKNPPTQRPAVFWHFFHKRLRILNQFFTHLLHVPVYARLHWITSNFNEVCQINCDYLVHIICSKCRTVS